MTEHLVETGRSPFRSCRNWPRFISPPDTAERSSDPAGDRGPVPPVMPLDRRPLASPGATGEIWRLAGTGSAQTQIAHLVAEAKFPQRGWSWHADAAGAPCRSVWRAPADAHISACPLTARSSKRVAPVTPGRWRDFTPRSPIYLRHPNAVHLDARRRSARRGSTSHAHRRCRRHHAADDAPVDPGAAVHPPGPTGRAARRRSIWSPCSACACPAWARPTRVMVTRAEIQQQRGPAVGQPRQLTLAARPGRPHWFRDFSQGTPACVTHHPLGRPHRGGATRSRRRFRPPPFPARRCRSSPTTTDYAIAS